jgi:hypothetical protein
VLPAAEGAWAIGWGAITGVAGGLATFDLNALFGIEAPTWPNLAWYLGLGALTGAMGGAMSAGRGGVRYVALSAKALLKELGKAVLPGLVGEFREIKKAIGLTASTIVNGATTFANTVASGATTLGSYAYNGASTLATTAVSGATTLGSYAYSGASTAASTVVSGVTTLGSYAYTGVTDAWNAFGSFF